MPIVPNNEKQFQISHTKEISHLSIEIGRGDFHSTISSSSYRVCRERMNTQLGKINQCLVRQQGGLIHLL